MRKSPLKLAADNPAVEPPAEQAKPIQVTNETDSLRTQIIFQHVLMAQAQFDNHVLQLKLKYQVPVEWSYDPNAGWFTPPSLPPPPLGANRRTVKLKSKD
jgi:hypothetical protein